MAQLNLTIEKMNLLKLIVEKDLDVLGETDSECGKELLKQKLLILSAIESAIFHNGMED